MFMHEFLSIITYWFTQPTEIYFIFEQAWSLNINGKTHFEMC